MKRIPLLLLALGSLFLGACSREPTTYEGRIYYSRQEKDRFVMEWTDPDGKAVHPLLPEAGDARSPVASADGDRLAFLKGSPPRVHVASLATNQEEQVSTFDSTCSRAAWAPVGNRLAYLHFPPNGRAQLVVQPVGGQAAVIHTARNLGVPTWSSLGNRVYYTEVDAAATPRVWSRKTDGSEPEVVLENASDPCLAPEGSQLAVISDGKLHVYNLRQKSLRKVLDRPGASLPTWSPDSKRLAFLTDGQVWVVDPFGKDLKQITNVQGGVYDAFWGKGP